LLPLDWDIRQCRLDKWADAACRQMVKAGVDPEEAKQEATRYRKAIEWQVITIFSEELVARSKRGLGMLVPTPEYAALSRR
jgi:hypothetical protein